MKISLEEEQGILREAAARHGVSSPNQVPVLGAESQGMGADRQTDMVQASTSHGTWQISDLSFLICKMEMLLVLQSRREESRRECKGPAYRRYLVDGTW